jgi:thiol-disulfide isomerase/thioredoxin
LIAVGLICLQTASAPAQEPLIAKTRAPEWKLSDLDGKLVKFSDFRGHVLILDFWATWCMPCRIEIPHFVELQNQYGDKGLRVIGVSLDAQGPEFVKKFAKRLDVTARAAFTTSGLACRIFVFPAANRCLRSSISPLPVGH